MTYRTLKDTKDFDDLLLGDNLIDSSELDVIDDVPADIFDDEEFDNDDSIECIECDSLGEIVDVFDISPDDLGNFALEGSEGFSTSFIAKPKIKVKAKANLKVSAPKISAKAAIKVLPKVTVKSMAPKISAQAAANLKAKLQAAPRAAANLKVALKGALKSKVAPSHITIPKISLSGPFAPKAKATASFIAKVKAKAPHVSDKHIAKIQTAVVKSTIKGIRKKKQLPKQPRHSVVIHPKKAHQAICLGTTMSPNQIIDIVKNKYKKHSAQVIAQAKRCAASLGAHEAKGTANHIKKVKPASHALKTVAKKVKQSTPKKVTAKSHSMNSILQACGLPISKAG